MKPLSEFLFQRILYINLPRREDRRSRLESMLHEESLDVIFPICRVEAVGPEDIEREKIHEKTWLDFKNPHTYENPKVGEVCCAMSHIKAWQKVLEFNENSLILEDDATPIYPHETMIRLSTISNDVVLKRPWDMCYLGRQSLFWDEPIGESFCKPGFSWLLHAYILTPNGARMLLSTDFQRNLFSVDDYVPAMCGDALDIVTDRYREQEKLKCIAVTRDLFKQTIETDSFEARRADSDIERSPEIFAPGKDPEKEVYAHLYCGSDPKMCEVLEETVRKHGWKYSYNIFPHGAKWSGGDMTHTGGMEKLIRLRAALEHYSDTPDAIIVFTDAHDVLLLNTPRFVIRDWLEHFDDQRVTFAAETRLWPPREDPEANREIPGYEDLLIEQPLNSGLIIGRVSVLKCVLDIALERVSSPKEDDQARLQWVAFHHPNLVQIDSERRIFQCAADILFGAQLAFDGNWLFNQDKGTHPLILHLNGPSKRISQRLTDIMRNPGTGYILDLGNGGEDTNYGMIEVSRTAISN